MRSNDCTREIYGYVGHTSTTIDEGSLKKKKEFSIMCHSWFKIESTKDPRSKSMTINDNKNTKNSHTTTETKRKKKKKSQLENTNIIK